jgi:TIGR03009 family protein
MMRLTWATILAILISAPTVAQQTRPPEYARPTQPTGQQQVQRPQAQRPQAPQQQAIAARGAAAAPTAPFPPLNDATQAHLQQLLQNWEQQSKGTKTLECKFKRWHYDGFAAPAGVHATKAEGVIKYAAPDKGLFRVDSLVFFTEMDAEKKPQYKAQPGKFGEHWVCNGQQLIEFDAGKKECRIQDLPKNLQGTQIFNSPLPFVFNLDAEEIQKRYWVRQIQAPKAGILLVEAWPKLQEDRAQYRLVQIALNSQTFLPEALIMYAPNFDRKTAPRWDHYEFVDVKRNGIGQGITSFLGNFIPQKPPANWKILRQGFVPPADPPQQAQAPAQNLK